MASIFNQRQKKSRTLFIISAVICVLLIFLCEKSIAKLRLGSEIPSKSKGMELSVGAASHFIETNKMIFGLNLVQAFPSQKISSRRLRLIKDLNPSFLRIPAGYNANHYDWNSGEFDLPDRRSEHSRILTLSKMFDISESMHIPVSYVININNSLDLIEGLVKKVKENGYQVRYWELGNEINQQSNLKNFHDFAGYYKKSLSVSKVIHTYFPGAEIALVGGSALHRYAAWNEGVEKQSHFQNIILHRYFGPTGENNNHDKNGLISWLHSYKVTLNQSNGGFLKWYKEFFPDKRYWISEYGLTYNGTPYQDTLGHAIWLARMLLAMLRDSSVVMAAYWNANASPYALVSKAKNSDRRIVLQAPYYAFSIISRLAGEYQYTAKPDVKGEGASCIQTQLFSNSKKPRLSRALGFYVINKCSKRIRLSFNDEYGLLSSAYGMSGATPLAKFRSNERAVSHDQMFISLGSWNFKKNVINIPKYAIGEINFTNSR